ncbi:MAG: alpha/beta hydrolase [Thaumarchaeota archaeon]|nr:alpha/beta hydrolase [Nitrososphaerota archaeon]
MPFAQAGSVRVYFESRGTGAPLVLLNGLMANTASWSFQLPTFLAQGYQVILMDFCGQGRSEKVRTRYDMRQHIQEVESVLDAAGVDKANLLGVSYGGEVAMLCAINIPSRVRSLVVSNSVSFIDRSLRARAERWLMATRFRSGRILWQMVYPDIYSAEFLERNWDFVQKTAPSFDLLDFDATGEMLKAFMALNITKELGSIAVPTLVISSEEDGTKPLRYSRVIHQSIAGSKYEVIAGAGHVAMWERPEEFNRLVIDFLKKIQA